MSIRTAQRRIAKARMAALGIDRINRRMGWKRDPKDRTEQPLWRRVLTGDLASKADTALCPPRRKRRIRRISDAAKD